MKLISHRGNTSGKNINLENKPSYIDDAIKQGFEVEIDFWKVSDLFFLGHDEPQYEIDLNWIIQRKESLWIHCKNIDSLTFLEKNKLDLNFFWHESDTLTLTSKKNIWVFPGKQPVKNSIAVLPELYNDDVSECYGVCSDFIKKYT